MIQPVNFDFSTTYQRKIGDATVSVNIRMNGRDNYDDYGDRMPTVAVVTTNVDRGFLTTEDNDDVAKFVKEASDSFKQIVKEVDRK